MKNNFIGDMVFDFVYGMAVNDAMIRLGGKIKIRDNNEIKMSVRSYAEAVINGKCERDETGRELFEKTINDIIRANGDDVKGFCFGRAQKLVNMAMKYLFVRYSDTDKARRFDVCDAPMDSIMRDYVYAYFKSQGKTLGFRDAAWSKIEKDNSSENRRYWRENYDVFQLAIADIIKSENLNCNKIEFDYYFWHRGISHNNISTFRTLMDEKKRNV